MRKNITVLQVFPSYQTHFEEVQFHVEIQSGNMRTMDLDSLNSLVASI